nr:MAG TPA: hypothetical protein [Caudoviricetes sp.]
MNVFRSLGNKFFFYFLHIIAKSRRVDSVFTVGYRIFVHGYQLPSWIALKSYHFIIPQKHHKHQ